MVQAGMIRIEALYDAWCKQHPLHPLHTHYTPFLHSLHPHYTLTTLQLDRCALAANGVAASGVAANGVAVSPSYAQASTVCSAWWMQYTVPSGRYNPL
jgi:hypothetical protein